MTLTRSPSTGQLTATTLAATNSTLTYNPFGEPETETTTHPTGSYQETYERDALGRITKRTELSSSGTTTYDFTYDQAGRLTSVERNGALYRAYTFDANGNRLSATKQTPSGPETQTATFDAQDRQTTSGPYALTYNANGELTEKTNTSTNESLTLTYKTSGDLATAEAPTGTTYSYQYDAFGNRTAELEDGNLKAAYLYAPGISGPVAKVNSSGQEEARYIYATKSHVPDYLVAGSATYRLITDQLGSVRFVVNASTGHVAQEITYDPFGEVISDSNPGFQPFGYAGGLYEHETGLTHFGAREYDAELGRWTASDPIGFGGGDTNLYGYVVQDPVNLVDPSGLDWITTVGTRWTGYADGVSFGFTDKARDWLGVPEGINKCSLDYRASKGAGRVAGAIAGGVATGGVTSAAAGGGMAAGAAGGIVAGATETALVNGTSTTVNDLIFGAALGAGAGIVASPVAGALAWDFGQELAAATTAAAGTTYANGGYAGAGGAGGCGC